MKFVARVLLFPVVLLSAFLVLMLKWTLNLSAFVLALPMLYIFGISARKAVISQNGKTIILKTNLISSTHLSSLL